MQKITIDAQLANDIGNYLAQRPWAEVNSLIARLMAAGRQVEVKESQTTPRKSKLTEAEPKSGDDAAKVES